VTVNLVWHRDAILIADAVKYLSQPPKLVYSLQDPSDNQAFTFFSREPSTSNPQLQQARAQRGATGWLPCSLLVNLMVQTHFIHQAIGGFSKANSKATAAKHTCNSRELAFFLYNPWIILTSLIHATSVPTELMAWHPNGPRHRNQNIAKAGSTYHKSQL